MADAAHVGFRTIDGVRVRCAESTGPSAPSILPTSPWSESVYAFAPIWRSLAAVAPLVAVTFRASADPSGGTTSCHLARWASSSSGS